MKTALYVIAGLFVVLYLAAQDHAEQRRAKKAGAEWEGEQS